MIFHYALLKRGRVYPETPDLEDSCFHTTFRDFITTVDGGRKAVDVDVCEYANMLRQVLTLDDGTRVSRKEGV